jgi:hypothetical protein
MTDMIKDFQNVVDTSNGFVLKVGDIAEAVIYALGTPETVEVSTDKMPIHEHIHTVTSLSKIIVTQILLVPRFPHLFYFVSNLRYLYKKCYSLYRYMNSYNWYNNPRAR